jgi:pimeloyl-ACP methyl ester carboxylesterase
MLTFLSATSSVLNTPLKDQFCQHYYTGTGNCAALRSQVEAHSRTLPTLELGDRGAPPLLLLHGTYDTHATWANLFEAFCAPPHGKHFCIAPAIFDYHPDYPLVPDSSLRWYKQAEAYLTVVEELKLSGITVVAHAQAGIWAFQMAYKASHLFKQVVLLEAGEWPDKQYDIGPGHPFDNILTLIKPKDLLPQPWLAHGSLPPAVAAKAFRDHDSTLIRAHMQKYANPCPDCRIAPDGADWVLGWTMNDMINQYPPGDTHYDHIEPRIPKEEWAFFSVPSIPSHLRILLLYKRCNYWPSHQSFSGDFLAWLDETGNEHHALCVPTEKFHFLHVHMREDVNRIVGEWLGRSKAATAASRGAQPPQGRGTSSVWNLALLGSTALIARARHSWRAMHPVL